MIEPVLLQVVQLLNRTRDRASVIAGRTTDYVIEPVPIHLPLLRPQTTKLVQVACGRAHTVIVTEGEGGKKVGHIPQV